MALKYIVLFAALACIGTCTQNLPNYITACKHDDPNFNQCALEAGRKAIPFLIKGDKKLRLRPLDPLHIPEIRLDTSGNLKLSLSDVTLMGLGDMDLKKVNFDLKNKMVDLSFDVERLVVLGDYNIEGRILVLPITGNGKINVTLTHGKIGYGFKYDLVEKEGKEYVSPHAPVVTLQSKRNYFDLENLFGGDPRLGPEMNRFLNENQEEMTKELTPSITETISAIASSIVDTVIAKVPFDELVL